MGRCDLDSVEKFLQSILLVPDLFVKFQQPGIVIMLHALGAVQVIKIRMWAFQGY